jgi:hypothetical protein
MLFYRYPRISQSVIIKDQKQESKFKLPCKFILKWNKKYWEELIRLLSLHKLTVNNLVAMEHKQSKPTAEQGSPNNFEPQ